MNLNKAIPTYGFMLLTGSTMGILLAVTFTFILPLILNEGLVFNEGVSGIIFFTVLTMLGYYMFKYNFNENGKGDINEKFPQ
jgi:hypothetical protein